MPDPTPLSSAPPDRQLAPGRPTVGIVVRRPAVLRQLVRTMRSALGLLIEVADAVVEEARDTVRSART